VLEPLALRQLGAVPSKAGCNWTDRAYSEVTEPFVVATQRLLHLADKMRQVRSGQSQPEVEKRKVVCYDVLR
jgi:hypothetical protein